MNRLTESHYEPELSGVHDGMSQLDFFTLYDKYAPALLGVITKIISDEAEAAVLLETTFTKIHSEINKPRSEQQPLFSWLITTARCTALNALKERRQLTPVLQLTETGKVVPLPASDTDVSTGFSKDSTDPRLKKLLNFVLFDNCTPEEAAVSIGMPVETARQQLRLAMQQLRTRPKA
ncbi:RNA polymerase sigma factor [Spirosoma flavum]|uniref:RNA polymerase sigma factor n=1 Tax=Spirosoma flavum TaxID=2048557 RepID=A0ABW6ABG6_9BACT